MWKINLFIFLYVAAIILLIVFGKWWILFGLWVIGLIWFIYAVETAPVVPKELEDMFDD